jgi:hypothetical protein
VGLGVGLGIGLALAAMAFLATVAVIRRSKKKRGQEDVDATNCSRSKLPDITLSIAQTSPASGKLTPKRSRRDAVQPQSFAFDAVVPTDL